MRALTNKQTHRRTDATNYIISLASRSIIRAPPIVWPKQNSFIQYNWPPLESSEHQLQLCIIRLHLVRAPVLLKEVKPFWEMDLGPRLQPVKLGRTKLIHTPQLYQVQLATYTPCFFYFKKRQVSSRQHQVASLRFEYICRLTVMPLRLIGKLHHFSTT